MKKVSLILAFLFLTVFLTGCTDKNNSKDLLNRIQLRNRIVVGIKADSKPFSFVKNGELQGFDVDLAHSIARKLLGNDTSESLEFVYVTADSRISDLNSKKVDIIISTMSINPKRASIIDFTNPYYIAGQALMVKIGSNVKSIESLNNKKVGIILGTTGERTIRQLAPNANVIGKATYSEVFNLLKENKVDAILADDTILYGFLMEQKGYRILQKRYTKEYYAIALRQGEENKALKEELNNIIESMQKTGKLNRIKEKWIPNIHKY